MFKNINMVTVEVVMIIFIDRAVIVAVLVAKRGGGGSVGSGSDAEEVAMKCHRGSYNIGNDHGIFVGYLEKAEFF